MVSGYEKSPDYGGRPPPNWFWVVVAVIVFGVPGFVWLMTILES